MHMENSQIYRDAPNKLEAMIMENGSTNLNLQNSQHQLQISQRLLDIARQQRTNGLSTTLNTRETLGEEYPRFQYQDMADSSSCVPNISDSKVVRGA